MAFNLAQTFKSAQARLTDMWESLFPSIASTRELDNALKAKGWQIDYVFPEVFMPYTPLRMNMVVRDALGRNIQDDENLRKAFYDDQRAEAAKIRSKNSPHPN